MVVGTAGGTAEVVVGTVEVVVGTLETKPESQIIVKLITHSPSIGSDDFPLVKY